MSTEIAVQNAELSGPMRLMQIAIDKGASIEMLQQLMELQERAEANMARKAFFAAMAKFKETAPRIFKNVTKTAGSMDLHYASLDNVVETITPALSAVGIRHRWEMKQEGPVLTVTCALSHDLGHSESTSLVGPNDTSGAKNPIQAIASTTTYLQRYTLLAATGLAASGMDNDGGKPVKGAGMSLEDFAAHTEAIEAARTPDELRSVFNAAYKAAQLAGDKTAQADIIAAKNKRKAEL